jgi:succinoglycan biosynthesis transport protein ExoP
VTRDAATQFTPHRDTAHPHTRTEAVPMNTPTTALVPLPPGTRPRGPKVEPANPAMLALTYLRLHALAIAFCGGLLGVALAYAAYTLLPAKYESYALLQVASSPPGIAQGNDPSRNRTDFVTYLKTTAQLIKSDFVLSNALSDPKYQIGKLPTIADQKNPIKFLEEKVEVSFKEGSEIITIRMEGEHPADVAKIVDAVREAYYREVIEKEREAKKRLRVEVELAKTDLQGKINARNALRDRKPASLPPADGSGGPILQAGGVPVPPIPGLPADRAAPTVIAATAAMPANAVTAAALNLADNDSFKKARATTLLNRIAEYEVALQKFPVLIAEQKAVVARLQKELDDAAAPAPSPEAFAAADKDQEVLAMQAAAAKKRRDYDYLSGVVRDPRSDDMARKKIAVEAAEADAEATRLARATLLEGLRHRDRSDRAALALDDALRTQGRLVEEERVKRSIFEADRKEFDALPPDAKSAEEKQALVDPLRTDLLSEDGMYRRVAEQLIGLDFELKSPPRVVKRQDASAPSAKDPKKQAIAAVAAGLLGFGLVGLGFVGQEMRVRKVSSLAELKTVGAVPVVGVVPWLPTAATAADPLKKADVTEAIDKLRSVVAQTWLTRGVRTIAVTSPHGDEGKAFAAFGLANALALSNVRTLLVDLDLRNPSLHHFAGLPNAAGACEVFCGTCGSREAQVVLPSGLILLPAGTWSDDLRRTAVGARLDDLLADVRHDFDCVVLHGHGLLSVAESIETVRRADAVLLCALYRETRMPLLKRAIDRLTALDVPATGVLYVGATRHEALC